MKPADTDGYTIRNMPPGELTSENCEFTPDMRVAKVYNHDTDKPFVMLAFGEAPPYACWSFNDWADIDLLRDELRRLGVEAFGPQPN